MKMWKEMIDNGLHETSFISTTATAGSVAGAVGTTTTANHNLNFTDDEKPDRNRRYSAWITV